MQFFTLAALFGAAAMAAPAPDPNTYENIDISDFSLLKNNGIIQHVSFKISGKNATGLECSGGPYPAVLDGTVQSCGDSEYSFAMVSPKSGDTNAFGVRIYHALGVAFGLWGEGEVPTNCHQTGNGINDSICDQANDYTLVITATG